MTKLQLSRMSSKRRGTFSESPMNTEKCNEYKAERKEQD